jgi:hypothetical protein
MPQFSAMLFDWVRRTKTSVAGAWRPPSIPREDGRGDPLIYRLRYWPELPSSTRTADVLRLLSVMSHRPVNRRWMLANTRLETAHVDSLLQRLIARGAVEVIDASSFPGKP